MNKFTDVKTSLTRCLENLKKNNDNLQKDISDLYDGNHILRHIVSENDIGSLMTLGKNLEINLTMVNRSKMKCVFFGKTSNGKSAVINAILHKKVLPSSFGSTTSCFIAVEGCYDDEGYIRTDSNRDNIPLDMLKKLSSCNEEGHYGVNKMITIYWPKKHCDLLQHEIQLVDSPGVDFSIGNDAQLKLFCQDSDVFVYVVDAVSTLCQTEIRFFKDVKNDFGNPTLFVLMNKWDICEAETDVKELNEVKTQHLNAIKNIFETNMHIDYEEEKRVFFVSAKNSLTGSTPEFEKFIGCLTCEMTKHAVVTKFKQHSEKGYDSIATVTDIANKIISSKTVDGNVSFPIEKKVDNLITTSFDKIEVESLCNIKLKCDSYDYDQPTSHENIYAMIKEEFNTLFDKIKSEVDDILPKTRDLLKRHSPVKAEDCVMEKYVPISINEGISGLETDFYKNNNRDNAIDTAYSGLASEMQKWRDCWTAKRIKGLKDELIRKINEYFSNVVKGVISNSKKDITKRIKVFTDAFVRDYKQMWELLEKASKRKSELDSIRSDLSEIRQKISS